MNTSVIENPNYDYEYVELDLLNLPRDLSTNLNKDSDNQKENVAPSKMFRMVTYEETGVFLEENLNKNTKTKIKNDMKVITNFFTSIGEERAPGQIPPNDLGSIMARFFLGVLKKDGTEYELDSLGSMYNSLHRHLRDMKSPIGYVLTFLYPRGGGYTVLPLSVRPRYFRRIFLSNCRWQKSDIWVTSVI